MRRTTLWLLWLLVGLALSPSCLAADDGMFLSTFSGVYNLGDHRTGSGHTTATEVGFEVHLEGREVDLLDRPFPMRPIVGFGATAAGSYWAFAGARWERRLDRHWTLAPSVAISYYEQGEGKNLGGALEFRTAFEVSYQFGERLRLGLMLHHLSNAGIYHPNPGSESLLLTVTAPLGR
jgi:lipid A 3-O-deacylase